MRRISLKSVSSQWFTTADTHGRLCSLPVQCNAMPKVLMCCVPPHPLLMCFKCKAKGGWTRVLGETVNV